MLRRSFAILVALSLVAGLTAADKPKPIKPSKSFTGRIDKDQQKEGPANGVIANAKDLEKLWKAWKIKDEMPKVDFDKELVLIATGQCGKVTLAPSLDDKGDVKTLALATRDLREDFAYNIVVISREGVKTINGKEIK